MIVIPELKKIAAANDKIERLVKIVSQKIDADGLWLPGAQFVNGCKEKMAIFSAASTSLTIMVLWMTCIIASSMQAGVRMIFTAPCILKPTFPASLWPYHLMCEVSTNENHHGRCGI